MVATSNKPSHLSKAVGDHGLEVVIRKLESVAVEGGGVRAALLQGGREIVTDAEGAVVRGGGEVAGVGGGDEDLTPTAVKRQKRWNSDDGGMAAIGGERERERLRDQRRDRKCVCDGIGTVYLYIYIATEMMEL
ncbi:hypothetical protein LOK49_LG15G00755 [Camellia lanceoleosa]|uniref:Uncharacterized protein n=1 Tax=Camellia lanceoleosa TaxID=1840588 RepID=A0ACC0F2N1_9ERIC|nr:hypothetical protein LOK49_LG15G00755 [Camellia lanceoleosa]